ADGGEQPPIHVPPFRQCLNLLHRTGTVPNGTKRLSRPRGWRRRIPRDDIERRPSRGRRLRSPTIRPVPRGGQSWGVRWGRAARVLAVPPRTAQDGPESAALGDERGARRCRLVERSLLGGRQLDLEDLLHPAP